MPLKVINVYYTYKNARTHVHTHVHLTIFVNLGLIKPIFPFPFCAFVIHTYTSKHNTVFYCLLTVKDQIMKTLF